MMLTQRFFNIYKSNNINRCIIINNIRTLSITSSRLLAGNPKDGNDKQQGKQINESQTIDNEIVHLEDDQSIQIPVYAVNPNETLDIRKQRLIYQSRKRGMLENDLLLSTFASKYLKDMNEIQINLYDKLINTPSNDWDIYYWATNTKPTPDEYSSEIMDLLKKHVQNENREKRIRMPALD